MLCRLWRGWRIAVRDAAQSTPRASHSAATAAGALLAVEASVQPPLPATGLVAERLATGHTAALDPAESERRHWTVLFCDLGRSRGLRRASILKSGRTLLRHKSIYNRKPRAKGSFGVRHPRMPSATRSKLPVRRLDIRLRPLPVG